ncbi:MAG TPA: hydroxymethylbilane synthase [Thermoanaerobaculales bacterium]|nr:hydroxymethylbilane synthase [Thermoanaerobaculales bacterium]HQL29299.1 hydroxymethylbilane synthase [Thermoanaerobaculales bacterium]HQN97192.1 hydroxymethylbilane synthase [Thermoanaerobaculales bacterium]
MSEALTLRVGTRGSELALWQAERVAGRARDELGIGCRIEVIRTRGDRIQDLAVPTSEGKGLFTRELQEALLERRVDLVVHSLKDLPVEEPPGLEVAAIPERGAASDLLLAPRGTVRATPADPIGLPEGAVVGTSSPRRAAQLLALRPDLQVRALRGNVPTRVGRLREGRYDAVVLAAAGVDRLALALDGLDRSDLPPEVMLPAPGQGALAIETRQHDDVTLALRRLDDPSAARCVGAERRLLALLGGGCHLPLGCLATEDGGAIRLQAALGAVDSGTGRAEVTRVAAVATAPQAAARACFEALRLAMPEAVGR